METLSDDRDDLGNRRLFPKSLFVSQIARYAFQNGGISFRVKFGTIDRRIAKVPLSLQQIP